MQSVQNVQSIDHMSSASRPSFRSCLGKGQNSVAEMHLTILQRHIYDDESMPRQQEDATAPQMQKLGLFCCAALVDVNRSRRYPALVTDIRNRKPRPRYWNSSARHANLMETATFPHALGAHPLTSLSPFETLFLT